MLGRGNSWERPLVRACTILGCSQAGPELGLATEDLEGESRHLLTAVRDSLCCQMAVVHVEEEGLVQPTEEAQKDHGVSREELTSDSVGEVGIV